MGKKFSKLCGTKQIKVLMFGLNGSGKTTILYKLKLGHEIKTTPTLGFNMETIGYKNIEMIIWEFGSQSRDTNNHYLWKHYFSSIDGLIFVIDSTDNHRIFEARHELHQIINEKELKNAIVIVFANKQDLANSMNLKEIEHKLALRDIEFSQTRECHIQGVSGKTGNGLYDGLNWIVSKS